MRIAVTGASGFIGGAVARDLAAHGHEVIGFGRRPDAFREGRYRMWHLTSGPLNNAPRVDAVVHAAGVIADWMSLDDARAINVEGTRRVIDAFPGARFVHLSTASVYPTSRSNIHVAESAKLPKRFISTYSRSKAEAEGLFDGLNAAILRPRSVYGRGDTVLLPGLLGAISDGSISLPSGGNVPYTFTSIHNLVQAVRLAVPNAAPRGIFNVGDAEPVILSAFVRELLRAKTGADVTIKDVSYRGAYLRAQFAELSARIRSTRPTTTRYAVAELGLERTLDLTAARTLLGFTPTATSPEGAETW